MSHPCIEYMKRKHILREKTYPASKFGYNLHDSLVTASSCVLHKPPFEQVARCFPPIQKHSLRLPKCISHKIQNVFRSNFPNAFFNSVIHHSLSRRAASNTETFSLRPADVSVQARARGNWFQAKPCQRRLACLKRSRYTE